MGKCGLRECWTLSNGWKLMKQGNQENPLKGTQLADLSSSTAPSFIDYPLRCKGTRRAPLSNWSAPSLPHLLFFTSAVKTYSTSVSLLFSIFQPLAILLCFAFTPSHGISYELHLPLETYSTSTVLQLCPPSSSIHISSWMLISYTIAVAMVHCVSPGSAR